MSVTDNKGPLEPYGVTVFCDDVRNEVDGKTTYVGCYTSALHITDAAFPLMIPKLCFAIHYREPIELPPVPLRLKIYFPGDAPDQPTVSIDPPLSALEEPATLPTEGKELVRQITISGGLVQPLVREPGTIRVRMERAGKVIKLGSLRITSAN